MGKKRENVSGCGFNDVVVFEGDEQGNGNADFVEVVDSEQLHGVYPPRQRNSKEKIGT